MEINNKNKLNILSPGKTLLSGGYLILEKSNRGLVINIDTYINCESSYIINRKENINEKNALLLFNIFSEYLNQQLNYLVSLEPINSEGYEIKISEKNNKDNKWIKNCIISSLNIYLSQFNYFDKLLNEKDQLEININIKSDYRFYSYSKDKVSNIIKTGLGSSSALINSLTTSLIFIYDNYFRNKKYPNNNTIRNIEDKDITAIILGSCLLSNNLSQNKIGSCFDIISSLFGSQIFIQTQQNLILNSPLNINKENKSKVNNFIEYLKEDYIPNIKYFEDCSKNKILFISLEIGTDTRIFVKKVLEYANNKKTNKLFDDELFSELKKINEKIIEIFLFGLNKDNVLLLKEYCEKYRAIIRKISEESNVEIEPKILTPLLNDLIENTNIIYANCPGAGGYDSIVIIAKENVEESILIKEVNNIISNFNNKNKDNKLNIKANLLNANIPKCPGTIIQS